MTVRRYSHTAPFTLYYPSRLRNQMYHSMLQRMAPACYLNRCTGIGTSVRSARNVVPALVLVAVSHHRSGNFGATVPLEESRQTLVWPLKVDKLWFDPFPESTLLRKAARMFPFQACLLSANLSKSTSDDRLCLCTNDFIPNIPLGHDYACLSFPK